MKRHHTCARREETKDVEGLKKKERDRERDRERDSERKRKRERERERERTGGRGGRERGGEREAWAPKNCDKAGSNPFNPTVKVVTVCRST